MELAHGGTVFLDEVGDISPELQTKLLRFLQEREFERVGGTRLISVDIRIIAATNRNLDVAVKEGRFREDLYHRLNVIAISLPPLRERKEDIPALSQYFAWRYSLETRKNFTEITQEAKEKLLAYDWPGNVRELANVIERAIVLGKGSKIGVEDLPGQISARELRVTGNGTFYRQGMNAARRELILQALARAQGNRAAAARALGLDPKYLLRLMKTLQID
jgi:transcriptional regulator with PAS, ATPase and Fis domain